MTAPRTRQMILVSLITFCWTLAAALAFAGGVSRNGWLYVGAMVFFVNGFVPIPFLRHALALEETPERARATLIGRMAPRQKEVILTTLLVLCGVMAVGEAFVGWFRDEGWRYVQATGLFFTGSVFFLMLRRIRISEADSEQPANNEQ